MEINDECYYIVQGFMKNRLGLKGIKRDLYAIIYGFSQDGESEYTGGISYLIEWLDISKPTVIKALQELVEKDLIIKRVEVINGVSFNRYRANLEILTGGKKILPVVKNSNGVGKEILPNNENNKNNIINFISEKELKETKKEKKEKYCIEILDYLNQQAGTRYKAIESNLKFINARLEHYTPEELKSVVDIKVEEWKGTKMQMYLRPETLFNATKFECYINQINDVNNSAPPPEQNGKTSMAEKLQQAISIVMNGGNQ